MSQIDAKVLDEISALLEASDYATIFGTLVSRAIDARSCNTIVSWAKANATNLESRCTDNLNEYLHLEETAMRERIRVYAEQQEALFNVRKAQVGRAKAVLIRLAREVARRADASDGIDSGSVTTAAASDRRTGGDETSSSAADDEELFELDGFESSENQGDELEQNDEDGSDNHSTDSHLTAPAVEPATSLPIRMPGFANNWRRKSQENAVDETETCQFEKMGESMKKIAQSTHESSTKMFGDLPRPRVNSDAARRFPRK